MVFGKVRLSAVLGLFGVVILYFATRLTNIMSLPLFTDEAIYVRWSQIAKQDASWRFISLTDGKQPSFIWLAINSMRIFHDPLLATRMVSVCAGFGALIGIMLVTLELFKKKRTGGIINKIFGHVLENPALGFIIAFLFILFPFALVYDRMALYDSLVAMVMIWSLYLEILLVRYVRLDIALLAGLVIGSALLTKTSGFFAIYLLPFSLFLFDFKQKDLRKKLIEWVVFAAVAVLISYGLYSILRLSPYYYIIDEKNALFVRPVPLWLSQLLSAVKTQNFSWFEYISGNFNAIIGWFIKYVSLPVLALAVLSFFLKGYLREKLLLLFWTILPFIALGFFGNTLYPRFIYFMTLPTLILASYSFYFLYTKIHPKIIFPIIFCVLAGFYLFADYYIIFDFPHAPLPQADLGQYINSWPAGGGVAQMVSYFNKVSEGGPIYVATQGTFGSLPTNTMQIYLEKNPNIKTRGVYPLPSEIPLDLVQKAKTMPVYYVFNDSEDAPITWPVTLVAKYQKGIGDRNLSIYKVNP